MTTRPNPIPLFLAVGEIAERLRVSTKTVRRWIERGELRAHRLGRQLRVSDQDLSAFLHRQWR